MNQEQQFLPAVLEIQETPPSPIGRVISWVIIGFLLCAVTWALLGSVDIVAVAQGRIIPSGHSKVIQPLEIGSVRAIHVSEGQAVKRGTVLIELDPQATVADQRRIADELAATESEMMRLSQLSNRLESGQPGAATPASPILDAPQRRLLQAQWQEYQSRLQTLNDEKTRHQAEYNSLLLQIKKLEAILPLLTRRAGKMEKLADQRYLSEEQYLEMEQRRLETEHDLAALRMRRQESRARIAESTSKSDQLRRETVSRTLLQLEQAVKRLAILRQELKKATARAEAQTLRSPVSGVVQQLAMHTVGGIVTPAQNLMVIVPAGEQLEVEALVANRDIGFISEGQQAEIKIDAFPFTRYGIVEAELTDISNDAISDEKRGLLYKVLARMTRDSIDIDGRRVKLSPGMSVALEVKTGERRLIEYFLAPLLQYRHESIRER